MKSWEMTSVTWRKLKEGCKLYFPQKKLRLRSQWPRRLASSLETHHHSPAHRGSLGSEVLESMGLYKRTLHQQRDAPESFPVLLSTGLSLWLICKLTNLENTSWESMMTFVRWKEASIIYNFLQALAFPVIFLKWPPELAESASKGNAL